MQKITFIMKSLYYRFQSMFQESEYSLLQKSTSYVLYEVIPYL